jgi:hypothetical protein
VTSAVPDLRRDYDCGTCDLARRAMFGCHGGGQTAHFKGTEHETRKCPRRHLIENADVVPVFALRRDVEHVDGLRRREVLTTAAIEAIAVVDDGVAHAREAEREREAKAKR